MSDKLEEKYTECVLSCPLEWYLTHSKRCIVLASILLVVIQI